MRIVSLIVLIAICLVFIGLPSYATVTPPEMTAKPCCDECNKNESQSGEHCSTPACPLFLCLLMNIVTPFTLSELSGNIHLPQLGEPVNLESPAKPIFHPPVVV